MAGKEKAPEHLSFSHRRLYKSLGIRNSSFEELVNGLRDKGESEILGNFVAKWDAFPEFSVGNWQFRNDLFVHSSTRLQSKSNDLHAVLIVKAGEPAKRSTRIQYSIFLDSSLTPQSEVEVREGSDQQKLITNRTELFAGQFLCALKAYLAIRESIGELSHPSGIGFERFESSMLQTLDVELLLADQPERQEVLNLICSPESVWEWLNYHGLGKITLQLHDQLVRQNDARLEQYYVGWMDRIRIRRETVMKQTRKVITISSNDDN